MKTDKLAIEYRAVEQLLPYANNSRTHTEAQVAQIAASLKEFGWTNPILVDAENGIIAGHGRLLAARKLGMQSVPVIELSHLTDRQKRAYVIADNKLAELAGWDTELLAIELADLTTFGFDVTLLGFKPEEIADLLVGPEFNPASADGQGRLDAKKPCTCPECGHVFTP